MPVIDASAAVDLLLGTDLGERVDAALSDVLSLDAPQLIDFEVASALRRLEALGKLESSRAVQALTDFLALSIIRYPARALLPRMWELRRRMTAYDASYVALAEALQLPLVTTDSRLARAGGHRAEILSIGA